MLLLAAVTAQAQDLLDGGAVATVTSIVDDPGSTVGDVLGTVTSTAGNATQSGPAGANPAAANPAAGTVGDVVAGASGSAGATAGAASPSGGTTTSGTTTSGGNTGDRSRANGESGRTRAKPGSGYRSRFDRLPRRAERLLERIELGRHVRANMRRLKELLAGSPSLRRRVLLSLRAELRRLRADGVTPRERRRIRRLRFVERGLRNFPATPAPSTASTPSVALGPSGSGSSVASGTGGAAAGAVAGKEAAGRSAGASDESPLSPADVLPHMPSPGGQGEIPVWLGIWLLALLGASVLTFVLAVANRVRLRSSKPPPFS
jgi:hypothetical protein